MQKNMLRFLIADDNPFIRCVVEKRLKLFNAMILHAETGTKALASLYCSIDVAIIDLGIPKHNGLSILSKAKQLNVATPIIIMSDDSDNVSREVALGLGAFSLIEKPFGTKELVESVADAVQFSMSQRTKVRVG